MQPHYGLRCCLLLAYRRFCIFGPVDLPSLIVTVCSSSSTAEPLTAMLEDAGPIKHLRSLPHPERSRGKNDWPQYRINLTFVSSTLRKRRMYVGMDILQCAH